MPVTAIFFRVMCKLPVSACKLMAVTYAYRDESSPEFPTGISNPDPDFSPGFRSRISDPDFRASFLTRISDPDFRISDPVFRTRISDPDFRPAFPTRIFWPGFSDPDFSPGFLTRISDPVSNPDFWLVFMTRNCNISWYLNHVNYSRLQAVLTWQQKIWLLQKPDDPVRRCNYTRGSASQISANHVVKKYSRHFVTFWHQLVAAALY
jgi:hypothetical protein